MGIVCPTRSWSGPSPCRASISACRAAASATGGPHSCVRSRRGNARDRALGWPRRSGPGGERRDGTDGCRRGFAERVGAGRSPRRCWPRLTRFCLARLSKDRTKRTVCTWPCNIYVLSHVTHVPALGSACVSQDCASGRSGQSLDGSRAEHLSIPIPENAKRCPSQRFFRWGIRAEKRRIAGASSVMVLRPALHSIAVAPHTRRHGGLQAHPCR
jgi:hypothetical protein